MNWNTEHVQIDFFLKTDHSGPVPDFPPDSATLPVNQHLAWASEMYHGAPERSQRVSIYSLRTIYIWFLPHENWSVQAVQLIIQKPPESSASVV